MVSNGGLMAFDGDCRRWEMWLASGVIKHGWKIPEQKGGFKLGKSQWDGKMEKCWGVLK